MNEQASQSKGTSTCAYRQKEIMRRRFSGRALVAMTLLTLSMTACNATGADSQTQADTVDSVADLKIGFTQLTLNAPYYVAMNKEAERLAGEQGFTLNLVNANNDAGAQIKQIEDLVAKGVNVLIVNPVEPETERAAIQAVSAKVPVIFIDNHVPDAGEVTAVASDNLTIATKAGALAAARIGDGKTIKMAILKGPATDTVVGPARREGFLKGLQEGGVKVEIVAEADANYTQEQAVGAAEDMLTAHPDIDLIYGYNDSMALGALTTLQSGRNTHVLVAGIDGQKEALAAIKDGGCSGQYVATGLNSPTLAAQAAVKLAVEVGTGKKTKEDVPPITYTAADGIDCNNVDQFYRADSTF